MKIKICPTCKKRKKISEFNSQGKYCLECHRKWAKRWRTNNREKNLQSHRRYDEKFVFSDNDEFRCGSCKKKKMGSEFSWKNKEKGIRSRMCKACQKIASRKSYLKNREVVCKRSANDRIRRRTEAAKFVMEFLRTHPCVDCGESRILRLSFDHDGSKKDFDICYGVGNGYGIGRIGSEIQKCKVRCFNCHMEKTAKERKFLSWNILEGLV